MKSPRLPIGKFIGLNTVITENSPELINVFEADGTMLYTTSNVKRILGYTPKEILGTTGFAYAHKQDIRKAAELFNNAINNLSAVHLLQFRIRHKNSRWVILETLVQAFVKNKKTYLLTCSREINARDRIEQYIKDADTKLSTIFNNAGVWICIVDLEGRMVDSNPYIEKMLGYKRKEIVNKFFSEITYKEDIENDMKLFNKMIANKLDKYVIKKRFIHKNGKLVWCELTASMVRDRYGNAKYGIGILEDITEKVESDNLRERFVSIISHELKNPLAVVDLNTQLLIKSCLKEEYTKPYLERLQKIQQELKRFADTIDELTFLASSEKNKFSLQLEVFDMKELVSEVVDESVNIEQNINISAAKGKLILNADRNKIKQVLINLLTNGSKYSPKNTSINIKIRKIDGNIVTSVEDKGEGIDEKKIPYIFDLFYQISNKKDGIGLGLYLCKTIIDTHRGKIWVKSKKNFGSTFYFSVPVNIV